MAAAGILKGGTEVCPRQHASPASRSQGLCARVVPWLGYLVMLGTLPACVSQGTYDAALIHPGGCLHATGAVPILQQAGL